MGAPPRRFRPLPTVLADATDGSPGGAARLRTAIWCWAGSRGLLWGAALCAIAVVGRRTVPMAKFDPQSLTRPFHAAWGNFVLSPAARWDSVWYLHIAHAGYFSRQSTAFFPLYPLLMSVAGGYGAELVLGTVISVVASTAGVYLLFRLARLDLSERAAVTAVLVLVLFPTGVFLSAVYSEGLFLALSVGAVYAARLDRWAIASLLGGLASATRSNGILISVPLVLIYLYGPRSASVPLPRRGWRPRYRLGRSAVWLLLVPAGLLGYLGYLWISLGSPVAPFASERLWRRSFAGPFGAVVKLVAILPHDAHLLASHQLHLDSYGTHDFVDVVFLALALAGLWLAWRRLPIAYSAYALVMLAQTLSEPFAPEPLGSFSRYLLVMFPLFLAWGSWLAERPAARRAALILSAALLVVFSGLWGIWEWVA